MRNTTLVGITSLFLACASANASNLTAVFHTSQGTLVGTSTSQVGIYSTQLMTEKLAGVLSGTNTPLDRTVQNQFETLTQPNGQVISPNLTGTQTLAFTQLSTDATGLTVKMSALVNAWTQSPIPELLAASFPSLTGKITSAAGWAQYSQGLSPITIEFTTTGARTLAKLMSYEFAASLAGEISYGQSNQVKLEAFGPNDVTSTSSATCTLTSADIQCDLPDVSATANYDYAP